LPRAHSGRWTLRKSPSWRCSPPPDLLHCVPHWGGRPPSTKRAGAMCLGDSLRPIDSVSLSRLALGALAALLTQPASAAQPLPSIVQGAGLSTRSPFADFTAPSGGQRVVIADGAQTDFFGWSVAIDGDTALVGAYGVTVDGNKQQGAAYVFTKTDAIW